MPITPTYPGVYIEEIPSGVHTITGVATSITAFIGRAARGPVDTPITIYSFADYERKFGGLWLDSTMSYAVRDFFLNGGGQAIIVRLYKGAGGAALLVNGALQLKAASPGHWGDTLRMRVFGSVPDEVAVRWGLTGAEMFNLLAHDTANGATEQFLNVSFKDSARRIDRVLANGSNLVTFNGPAITGSETVPTAQPDPAPGKTIWEDDNASTKVASTDVGADSPALTDDTASYGVESSKTGIYALKKVDLFNILCLPPDTRDNDTPADMLAAALALCVDRRAMLIVDPSVNWASEAILNDPASKLATYPNLSGAAARNAALYYPRVIEADPLRSGQPDTFVPCGLIAGAYARTDAQRGVWKAPAGIDIGLNGVLDLEAKLTDMENGALNQLGINCLRSFPVTGKVVWGARTLRGADQLADEYKYVPVRRLALFLEESLYRGTQWVVFEPNDEPLWAQIRLNVGAFMHNLFRQGAFQGKSPREAYFVKCDSETTTQNDINLGIVNIVVGFAPLKPAEFVIIQIQQMAGQIEV